MEQIQYYKLLSDMEGCKPTKPSGKPTTSFMIRNTCTDTLMYTLPPISIGTQNWGYTDRAKQSTKQNKRNQAHYGHRHCPMSAKAY